MKIVAFSNNVILDITARWSADYTAAQFTQLVADLTEVTQDELRYPPMLMIRTDMNRYSQSMSNVKNREGRRHVKAFIEVDLADLSFMKRDPNWN